MIHSSQPEAVHPAAPCLSRETTVKALWPCLPLSPPSLAALWCPVPPLGTVSNKHFFQWHWPLPVVSPQIKSGATMDLTTMPSPAISYPSPCSLHSRCTGPFLPLSHAKCGPASGPLHLLLSLPRWLLPQCAQGSAFPFDQISAVLMFYQRTALSTLLTSMLFHTPNAPYFSKGSYFIPHLLSTPDTIHIYF